MTSFIKGNFETKKKVEKREESKAEDLEARFEKAALRRLGGSISFVSKKKVKWD